MRSTVEHRHGHHSEHGALDAPEVQGREHELHRAADGHAGHAAEHDHAAHADVYKRRFWVTLVLAIPVVVYSEMVQDWFGYTAPSSRATAGSRPSSAPSSSSTAARSSSRAAWSEIRGRQPGMMLLDLAWRSPSRSSRSLATDARTGSTSSSGGSWRALVDDHAARPLAGDEGHRPGPGRARRARRAAARRGRARRRRRRRDASRSASCGPATSCSCGRAPGCPPTARSSTGDAELDESMITGESRPVAKARGRPRRRRHGRRPTPRSASGSTAVGDDTALAGIQRLVAEAQASRSRAQALADRAAALLFYVAAGAGDRDLRRLGARSATSTTPSISAVTVLVIACPHALGLAIPLVISLSTALAAAQPASSSRTAWRSSACASSTPSCSTRRAR